MKNPFDYRITKEKKLIVSRQHKIIKILKGEKVVEFESLLQKGGSEEEIQLKLARLTEHYKHGNERLQKENKKHHS